MKRPTKYAAYETGNVIVLFSLQNNGNSKIAFSGELIVNQFTFSKLQWEHAENLKLKEFFSLDAPNCLSCPFRNNNGCYTHKLHSWLSFKRHIKAAKEQLKVIPDLEEFDFSAVYRMAKQASFFRFGTYGEPVFIPLHAMREISKLVNFTGYTHAYKQFPEYKDFLMSSVHSEKEALEANLSGWRSYTIAVKGEKPANHSICPAAKGQQKTVCSACLRCAGLSSKAKSNIYIPQH